MRQIIEIAIIVGVGLALPFIGDILALMLTGELTYCFRMGQHINDELWFLFIMQAFNLIPITLCILYYKGCTVLKRYRFTPIYATYLFVIYSHYNATANWEGPFAWLVIIGAPLFSVPVFFVAFVFVLVINYDVLVRPAIDDSPSKNEDIEIEVKIDKKSDL